MELSDEALVLACRRGDTSAWEALVRRYQRLAYAIPRRAGLDREQSADVCQRVFVILVEKIDQIEQPARIGAWLATAAKHETWRVSRREQVAGAMKHLEAENQPAEEPLADTLLPDEALLLFHLRNSFEALKPRQRLEALLHFDSLRTPQPVGLRSGQPIERRLLFTASELSVDLRITPSGALWSLVGQVLGPSTGAGQVVLASQADTAEAVLNELSEFTLPPVPAGDYTLTLRLTGIEVDVGRLQVGS
jgi:DNA-directed RNA polymerase specialized sigma24 family protein